MTMYTRTPGSLLPQTSAQGRLSRAALVLRLAKEGSTYINLLEVHARR